jgi:hypothetical protein
MVGIRRNYWLAAFFIAGLVVGAVALPAAMWAWLLAALLGVAGVVLFRGNRWRSGALLLAAVALSLAMLDALTGWLTPAPMGHDLVHTTVPRRWPPPDPILGFRPKPNSEVIATATYGSEDVYRQTYHFDAEGARVTPPALAGADMYLFIGDSFIFGQGVPDDQTLPAQFARANDFKVRAVNLGVPGNALNHLGRAFEVGLLDRYATQRVKAVVTWIIPAQLARVTGDGPWLGSSPRYVLENGVLRHTGTFNEYRLLNPIAGAKYLLGEQFAFISAIGMKQRQEQQVELFVALLLRLQKHCRDKFDAPLIVLYAWPDDTVRPFEATEFGQPWLVAILERLSKLGIPLASVNALTNPYPASQLDIPHDGHPNAFTHELVAADLKRRLLPE